MQNCGRDDVELVFLGGEAWQRAGIRPQTASTLTIAAAGHPTWSKADVRHRRRQSVNACSDSERMGPNHDERSTTLGSSCRDDLRAQVQRTSRGSSRHQVSSTPHLHVMQLRRALPRRGMPQRKRHPQRSETARWGPTRHTGGRLTTAR